MANLDRKTLLGFLVGDFETAWSAVAQQQGPVPRCNFAFALQTMILLELACRTVDKSKREFLTTALRRRAKGYFTELPADAPPPKDFDLPGLVARGRRTLLHAIFDLTRNGLAHQYQPTLAALADGQHLHVTLTGADRALEDFPETPSDHLAANIDADGNVWITVRTDVLFVHIRDAIVEARIPEAALEHLVAPTESSKSYGRYDRDALVAALSDGGHFSLPPTRTALGYRPTISHGSPTGTSFGVGRGLKKSPDAG